VKANWIVEHLGDTIPYEKPDIMLVENYEKDNVISQSAFSIRQYHDMVIPIETIGVWKRKGTEKLFNT